MFRKLTLVSSFVCALSSAATAFGAGLNFPQIYFWPGNLVISRTVYDNNPNNIAIGTILPPNCAATAGKCSGPAEYNGAYPTVFNNDIIDGSFGITSKIFLDQVSILGWPINSLEVPSNIGSNPQGILVTSFSSKSELSLHLSTDDKSLTFMGYVSPVDATDVSNSNTPGAVDLTNPVGENAYRAVAQVDQFGKFQFTETNAYSGNNGRSAILNSAENVIYTAGDAGNGSKTQPVGVILGAGAQIMTPANQPESDQNPGQPTPVASFSVAQLGQPADKVGKDDNFRGMTVFNNVLYYTKGSGSNGVNTVYFVDTTGKACPNGVGLPAKNAPLPTSPLSYNPDTVQTDGLPNNMCILAGFPAVPNSLATTTAYPFGLWFADANTLYVADEGDGYTGGTDLYKHAADQTTAGLQKWIFDPAQKQWNFVYTLQNGLDLGTPYTVSGYPTGTNSATELPWGPATDGLRAITGLNDGLGLVSIWAVTSTVSGGGDPGADPNRVVVITDLLKNTNPSLAAKERFYTFRQAGFAEVLRGVSFTPGTLGQ